MIAEHIRLTSGGTVSVGVTGLGPDLVLLHSMLTDRHAFDRVLADLAESYTVHMVDLPGFGSTDLVGAELSDYGRLVGRYLVEYVEGPATVMGNGLGGFVALATAIAEPAAVARLAIIGAGPSFTDEQKTAFTMMRQRVGELGMAGIVEIAVRRIFTEGFLAEHPDVHEESRSVILQTPPEAIRTACLVLHGTDLSADIPNLAMPTLIVVGSDDQATPPSMARQLHALLPDSQLIELEGVAHGPQLQDPETFMAAISAFLRIPRP